MRQSTLETERQFRSAFDGVYGRLLVGSRAFFKAADILLMWRRARVIVMTRRSRQGGKYYTGASDSHVVITQN